MKGLPSEIEFGINPLTGNKLKWTLSETTHAYYGDVRRRIGHYYSKEPIAVLTLGDFASSYTSNYDLLESMSKVFFSKLNLEEQEEFVQGRYAIMGKVKSIGTWLKPLYMGHSIDFRNNGDYIDPITGEEINYVIFSDTAIGYRFFGGSTKERRSSFTAVKETMAISCKDVKCALYATAVFTEEREGC